MPLCPVWKKIVDISPTQILHFFCFDLNVHVQILNSLAFLLSPQPHQVPASHLRIFLWSFQYGWLQLSGFPLRAESSVSHRDQLELNPHWLYTWQGTVACNTSGFSCLDYLQWSQKGLRDILRLWDPTTRSGGDSVLDQIMWLRNSPES